MRVYRTVSIMLSSVTGRPCLKATDIYDQKCEIEQKNPKLPPGLPLVPSCTASMLPPGLTLVPSCTASKLPPGLTLVPSCTASKLPPGPPLVPSCTASVHLLADDDGELLTWGRHFHDPGDTEPRNRLNRSVAWLANRKSRLVPHASGMAG